MERIAWSISRRIWDLKRFGLTPLKLWARMSNKSESKILLVSIPKAGTHLVERALCLHPSLYRKVIPTLHEGNLAQHGGLARLLESMDPGQILVSHLQYADETAEKIRQRDVRTIFAIRDPRDIVVSRAHYVAHNRKHPYHILFRDRDFEDRVRMAILGDTATGYVGIKERLEKYEGWLDSATHIVRFEQLVSTTSRLTTLRGIYNYLGIELSDEILEHICSHIVSPVSPTFRKGSSGGWQSDLNAESRELFSGIVDSSLLKRYGYGASI